MGAKFLSEEYMREATERLAASTDFSNAITNVSLGLQFTVSGDDGDLSYYLSVADGAATMARGELSGADATVSSTYETAVALSKGDLNTQVAFMTGKIKVAGNMATLMMNQGVINAWTSALSGMDVDY
ncbi:MAG: SCP2 sterol-binding domain-containing protein [Acidimicrobiia bacterium]